MKISGLHRVRWPVDPQPILNAYNSVAEKSHTVLPFYSVSVSHYSIEIQLLGDVNYAGFPEAQKFYGREVLALTIWGFR
jgi:hypothetical protein